MRRNDTCAAPGSGVPHWHVILVSGRARRAQEYPPELCKAICRGLKKQKQRDEAGLYFIGNISLPETWSTDPFAIDKIVKEAKDSSDKLHEEDST